MSHPFPLSCELELSIQILSLNKFESVIYVGAVCWQGAQSLMPVVMKRKFNESVDVVQCPRCCDNHGCAIASQSIPMYYVRDSRVFVLLFFFQGTMELRKCACRFAAFRVWS